jgi:hypothetical protein
MRGAAPIFDGGKGIVKNIADAPKGQCLALQGRDKKVDGEITNA